MSVDVKALGKVGVLFGGRSSEREVSIMSGTGVLKALQSRGVDAHAFDPGAQTLAELEAARFDRAFIALHGRGGEDGTIQGLFEMLDIPFVGCDTAASALCMDKIFTKRTLAQAGLPTPRWVEIDRRSWHEEREGIERRCLELGLPIFVKPARLGSSVGISKVKTPGQLAAAVESALSHGRRALAEKGIDAREIEVAVLGNGHPRASVPGEVVPGHEFYDYEDKYLDSTSEILAPAPLDENLTRRVQALGVEVFRMLGCGGMARVDLFLERGGGGLWVNEVNTIPGFTSISLFPRLWGISGLDYPSLLDELVRLARTR